MALFGWVRPAAPRQRGDGYFAAVEDLTQRVNALERARHAMEAEHMAALDTLNRITKRQIERERQALARALPPEEPGEPPSREADETPYQMRKRLGKL